jgi:hypothetical protein
VEPFTKAAESLGILLFFYVFAVFVVGAPVTALFLKRGVAVSLDDGEAFLFSLALTLGVLYEHVRQSFEQKNRRKSSSLTFLDVRR